MPSMHTAKRTALYSEHVRVGAKMVEFAGWEMPIQYSSVITECKSVRERAGMFDVSHMGRLSFRGEKVLEFLEWITANDVSKLTNGGSQYSLLCYDNGTCVDDIIVYRVAESLFRMVVNAANHDKDLAWIESHNAYHVAITDETMRTAMIAVQGPEACEITQSLSKENLLAIKRFHSSECNIAGVNAFIARTGYTGEDGFELIIPAEESVKVWQALLEKNVVPCGLAARDVLRVEAGLPLYGHELSDKISPIEAGLGWVISKTKRFLGSDEIARVRKEGTARKLVGILMDERIVPRENYPVFCKDREIGKMSSGVFSPTLERGIGFAFLSSEYAEEGLRCEVFIRDKGFPATVVSKRFLKKK